MKTATIAWHDPIKFPAANQQVIVWLRGMVEPRPGFWDGKRWWMVFSMSKGGDPTPAGDIDAWAFFPDPPEQPV